MSERRAKQQRRLHPEVKQAKYNPGFGRTRRQRRAKLVEPGYTKPNYNYQLQNHDNDFTGHVVNDYRLQREPVQGYGLSNYVRHQISKAKRFERIKDARNSTKNS